MSGFDSLVWRLGGAVVGAVIGGVFYDSNKKSNGEEQEEPKKIEQPAVKPDQPKQTTDELNEEIDG